MSEGSIPVIAIDGGGGVGKSSTARALAERLDFLHVDTGSHYRAITNMLQNEGINYQQVDQIKQALSQWPVDSTLEGNHSLIRINHKDFDPVLLKSAQINAEVSYYAALPEVRQYIFHYQRSHRDLAALGGFKGLVMEGRDIGLNIFPDTPYKYFFVADAAAKRARRASEGVLDVIEKRDLIDSTQGQMKKADDAKVIDTTFMKREEVVAELYEEIKQRLANA